MLSTVNQTSWIICISTILSIITNVTLAICGGGRLIAIDYENNFFQINIDKKTITGPFEKPEETYPVALEYDCANQIMYESSGDSNQEMYQMNYESAKVIGAAISFTSGEDYTALAFIGSTLYGWRENDGFRMIDPVTGDDSTIIGIQGMDFGNVGGLAFDICTNKTYGVTTTAVNSLLFTIDFNTGIASEIGDTGKVGISALTFGENCILYGSGGRFVSYEMDATDPGYIYTIDIKTGAATFWLDVTDKEFDWSWNNPKKKPGIDALAFVSYSGECLTKSPTVSPSTAPTQITTTPTKNPTNPTKTPTKNPTNPTNAPTKNPTNPTNTPTKSPTSDSSDDQRSGLFAENKEDEENDTFIIKKSIKYVVNMDYNQLFYILVAIVIFLGVNMFGYWCLAKKKKKKKNY
eukprot:194698_1